MNGPPAARPAPADPGGIQARADGQRVEVRTYEGELVRMVSERVATGLVDSGLADERRDGLRLKLGIRHLPARMNRPSGRPDLERMRLKDPDRYWSLWRGKVDAKIGKGALGRRTVDRSICLRFQDDGASGQDPRK